MSRVVDLARERRRRQGLRPALDLIGGCSSIESVLNTALTAVDESERYELLRVLARGSYTDMILELVARFDIKDLDSTRAVG